MPRSGDLDPAFTFDVGRAKPQSPWEFKSMRERGRMACGESKTQNSVGRRRTAKCALLPPSSHSLTDHPTTRPHTGALKDARPTTGTTLEQKIAARLAERKGRQGAVKRGGGRGAAAAVADQPASSSDEEGDDDDGDSDSDAPLPGEADDSDSTSGSDAEEEEEDEDGEPAAAAAAAAAASSDDEDALPAAADSGDEGEEAAGGGPALSSSDDDGDDDNKARAAAAGRRQAAAGAKHSAAAARAVEGGRVFDAAPAGTAFTASSFASLRLSRPLVKACAALGYARPTPIQVSNGRRSKTNTHLSFFLHFFSVFLSFFFCADDEKQ